MLLIHSPPLLMTSLDLSLMTRAPFLMDAMSPVASHPPAKLLVAAVSYRL